MASLNLFFPPVLTTQRRVVRTGATASKSSGATASKSSGARSTEEKGILDFILGNLLKQDQFCETDPIMKKVEQKNTGGTGSRSSQAAAPQQKKNGGFDLGGLFSKK